jgi:hypothetical protein
MRRSLEEYQTWKRCSVCATYFFTSAVRCSQFEQHDLPAPLLVISDRQYARLTTLLDAMRDKLPADRLHAFGLFVLGLEEVSDRPVRSDLALALFEQREARLAERTVES